MNSDELYDAFRSDVVDTATPYLWSDDEVFRYMNSAYRMFVRLTGGIPDFTSDATKVAITAGENLVELHPSILRIRQCFRASDNGKIDIINPEDLPMLRDNDYGALKPVWMDDREGPVRYLIIGGEFQTAKVVQIPIYDDELNLVIYRLPLEQITGSGQEFSEVKEDHHIELLDWMEHLAYKKQDAETFDRAKSDEKEAKFRTYCATSKAEMARAKHKTRVVVYGGVGAT